MRRTANRAPCMMVKTIVAPVRTFRPRRRTGLVCVVFVVRTGCAHGGEDVLFGHAAARGWSSSSAGNTSKFGVLFGRAAAQGWSSWSLVRTGCIHSGEDVKIQTCALLKFLTIRKARSRHTTTKGICIYLRDDEDFVREEKSRKRGAASRDLVNRRPKGRDTRSKTHWTISCKSTGVHVPSAPHAWWSKL